MKVSHLQTISDHWNKQADQYAKDHPEHLNDRAHPSWGLWNVHEDELRIFNDAISTSTQLVDLGCGRGQDSVGWAKLGADVLALDISEEQLSNAILHPGVKYVLSPAERIPCLDSSIDIIFSDHGAFDHSPPRLLLKEARRALKKGGVLAFCTYSPVAYMCYSEKTGKISNSLSNDYPRDNIKYDGTITSAQFSYSGWISMFREFGFRVERLEEIRVDTDANDYFSELVDVDWASRWPCDIIWRVVKE